LALRYWKRMREAGAVHADDPRPAGTNPWQDRPAPTLGQLGHLGAIEGDDRADRYRDWAARMRDRKAAAGAGTPDTPPSTAGYWTAEALFADSRRVEAEENRSTPNPWRVRELLAVFDLRDGATTAEIGTAYRRLAKQHHPDRYVQADPDTQEFHADRMRRIIDAYHELRQLELV
jgi:DnaJ-domain-containing protein 1